MTEPALARLADGARCMLLDFDGPVGSILAGRSARIRSERHHRWGQPKQRAAA